MGGDIKGVSQKIKEGYFTELGVNAIWTTPVLENIKGSVDEGTGMSYPFHGYWTRDWTAFDSRFTTKEEFKEFVELAHSKDIKVLMDVIINHTGPVTKYDTQWPDEWVRTGPRCQYKDAPSTINCTLVENLPDIRTDLEQEVDLPPSIVEKWKKEGRYEQEMKELDEFFATTNYPRRPYYYIIKWLVDYIKEYGIDGFRVDTVKHTEAKVWKELFDEAQKAFIAYQKNKGIKEEDVEDFYMVGEVYNFYANMGQEFDYGDTKVNFFDNGFKSLINFDFKSDANKSYKEIFDKYQELMNGPFKGKSLVNYISSHDDSGPFDKNREQPIKSATALLLTQGGAQIYYGDETARSLTVEAKGDATLRSFMNWEELESNNEINGFKRKDILSHWQKLGRFRNNHLSVGAGQHEELTETPYVFKRSLTDDAVVIGLDLKKGEKTIPVGMTFKEGTLVTDYYSGKQSMIKNKEVTFDTPYDIVLVQK
jgi:alpha-amylase